MHTPSRRTLAAVLVLPALASPLLLTSTADAAQKSFHDQTHEKGIPASADIVKGSVGNGKSTVKATIKLRQLVPNKSDVGVLITPAGSKTSYAVGNDANGKRHHPAFESSRPSGGTKNVTCKALKVVLDKQASTVRITFPQKCLGKDAGTATFVLFAGAANTQNSYDFSKPVSIKRG